MATVVTAERAAGARVRRLLARASLLRALVRRPVGLLSLLVVACIFAVAICAPLLAPRSPTAIDVVNMFQGPSPAHLLGTDQLGRDNLSRLIFGGRTALGIAIPAVAAAFVVGLCLGLVAGYLGGWIDKLLIVLIDTGLSLPAVILALALLTVLGPSIGNTILLIAVGFAPYYARLARAQTLAAKQNPYVKAERALGASYIRTAWAFGLHDRVVFYKYALKNALVPVLGLFGMMLGYSLAGTLYAEVIFNRSGLGSLALQAITNRDWPIVRGTVLLYALFFILGNLISDLSYRFLDPRIRVEEGVEIPA